MIYCTNCGNQLRDDAKFCNKCGLRVYVEVENSYSEPEINEATQTSSFQPNLSQPEVKNAPAPKKKKSFFKRLLKFLLICFIIFIGVVYVLGSILESGSYKKAIASMEKGDYYSAKEAFDKISTYKDSKELINECNFNIAISLRDSGQIDEAVDIFNSLSNVKDCSAELKECDYLKAIAVYEDGDLSTAKSVFLKMPKYKDSSKYLSQIQEKEMQEAISLFEANELESARAMFTLIDYPQSQKYIEEIDSQYYTNALSLLNDKQFSEAAQIFSVLGDYEDAPDKLNECNLGIAIQLKENGEIEKAKDILVGLGDFQDSKAYLEEINDLYYAQALSMLNEKRYTEAIEAFTSLGDFKDCSDRILACHYGIASELKETGNYEEAIEKFSEITDYKDSSSQIQSCQNKILEAKKAEYVSVSYSELITHPEKYRGVKIKAYIYITDVDPGLLSDSIRGTLDGQKISINDERTIKEPNIVQNTSITIYGRGNGTTTLYTYRKGTGVLGLPEIIDTNEIPSISVDFIA